MPATETTSLISLTCLTSSSSPKQSKTGSRHPKTGKSKSGNSNSNSSAENMSARDRLTAGLNTAAVDDENNWEDDDSGSASGSASGGGGAPRMSRHHQQDGRLDNRQQGRQVMHGLRDNTNISLGLISTLFIVFSHLLL